MGKGSNAEGQQTEYPSVIVVVTGGGGFIGQHLVQELLAREARVRVLDDFSCGRRLTLSDPKLTVVEGCVTDAECVREICRGASKIFHLAAVVGQKEVTRRPDWAATVGEQSMRNLNAAAPDVPTIIFSSSAVYGMTREVACAEDDVLSSQGAIAYDGGRQGYAYGKWIAEKIAEERQPGSWLTVRPFNVIGPGQVGTYGMVVPRFVRAGLGGEALTIYGTGQQTRSFGDVRVFVPQVLALEQAWARKEAVDHVYNIGANAETSINELADTVGRVLGREIIRRYVPYEAVYPGKQDVERRRPDLRRIGAVLGSPAWPQLDESVRAVAEALAGGHVLPAAAGTPTRSAQPVLN